MGTLFYIVCGNAAMSEAENEMYQTLGSFGPDPHGVVFDVVIERGPSLADTWGGYSRDAAGRGQFIPPADRPTKPPILWRGVLRLPVKAVDTIDEAVSPVRSPELDEAVRSSLGIAIPALAANWEDQRSCFITLNLDSEHHPALRDVGLSLVVDLLRDGRKAEVAILSPIRPDGRPAVIQRFWAGEHDYMMQALHAVPPGASEREVARWTVRARGSSDGVYALWGKSSRWTGEVEIPLSRALEQERTRVEGEHAHR
jgi:hypothetical protein